VFNDLRCASRCPIRLAVSERAGSKTGSVFYISICFATQREVDEDAAAMAAVLRANPKLGEKLRRMRRLQRVPI
jgi:hypothetical protein